MFVVVAFVTVLSQWEFESLSLGKASCDRTVHAGWFSVSRIRLYQAIMIFLHAYAHGTSVYKFVQRPFMGVERLHRNLNLGS